MILDLNLCRATPTLTVKESEHISEHINHKIYVLGAVVGRTYAAAACNIVGVVGFRTNPAILEFARKVAVVKRYLGE